MSETAQEDGEKLTKSDGYKAASLSILIGLGMSLLIAPPWGYSGLAFILFGIVGMLAVWRDDDYEERVN